MRAFGQYGRFLRGDLTTGDLPSCAREKIAVSSRDPARDEMLARERQAVAQPVLADVIQPCKIREFRRGDGVAEDHEIHPEILHQGWQKTQVLPLQPGWIGSPDDGPIEGAAFPVDQMVTIEPLLIEPKDLKWEAPDLQEGRDHLKLSPVLDQVTRRI